MKHKQSLPKALRYTVAQFNAEFPDDDSCLEYIQEQRWPDGFFGGFARATRTPSLSFSAVGAPLVRNVGQRILRDKAEADDLVQEVFLYIHRRSTVFDSSKGSARSRMIQVACTQAVLRRRE